MSDLSNELTVFVISSGYNPNYDYCIEALNKQTVTFKLDIIKDYRPMSLAFQQMLARCKTPYYIEVDEDMVLNPDAVEIMHTAIKQSDSKMAMMAFALNDVHIDFDIMGVKIYKNTIFQKYPYNLECLSCEIEQLDRIKADGYNYDCNFKVVGQHSPHFTHSGIFERYFNLMEKFKEFRYGWMETLPLKLWEILKRDTNEQNLLAILGAFSSLLKTDVAEKEKDFTQTKMPEYGMIESFLTQPVSATVYMTSNCNYKCEWCFRQHDDIEPAPDMDIFRIRHLLTKFPSIQAVCICGFGETFLSPNLQYVIEEMKNRGIFVGVITNGSLLEDKLPELYKNEKFLPNYISISLNAPNAEIHKRITKTDTFEKVLRGVKLSVERGMETYISYVCTKESIKEVPEFLNLVQTLGVQTVHLHNLLPHYREEENEKFWDLVLQKSDAHLLDEVRKLPNANLVKLYPTLIDRNETRRYCHFPWKSIGVNGNGSISICNSVYPCKRENGTLDDPTLWQNKYCEDFRKSILGEQKPACRTCFRNWEIKPC